MNTFSAVSVSLALWIRRGLSQYVKIFAAIRDGLVWDKKGLNFQALLRVWRE